MFLQGKNTIIWLKYEIILILFVNAFSSLHSKFEPWVCPVCAHGLQGSARRGAGVSLVTSTYQYAAKRQVHSKTRTTFTHHAETECCH